MAPDGTASAVDDRTVVRRPLAVAAPAVASPGPATRLPDEAPAVPASLRAGDDGAAERAGDTAAGAETRIAPSPTALVPPPAAGPASRPGTRSTTNPLGIVLGAIGLAAFGFVFWKGKVSGFYLSEAPTLAVVAVVAAVSLGIAARLLRR